MLTACSTPSSSASQISGSQELGTKKTDFAESITLMGGQNNIKEIDCELFKKFEDETGIEVKVLLTPDGE